jgi:hypothetical protein
VEELLAEKEPVHQEVKTPIEPVQGIDLLGVMPIILHKLPDDRVVSLFHMGIVIFVVGMGPSKGDSTDMAEEDEMPIHEPTPIVGMETHDLSRVSVQTQLKGSDHIDLCFRSYGSCFDPSRGTVGDGQAYPKSSTACPPS